MAYSSQLFEDTFPEKFYWKSTGSRSGVELGKYHYGAFILMDVPEGFVNTVPQAEVQSHHPVQLYLYSPHHSYKLTAAPGTSFVFNGEVTTKATINENNITNVSRMYYMRMIVT